MKKDNAFQYYNGEEVIHDESELTLEEDKELFKQYYDEMVQRVIDGYNIEVVIWINMPNPQRYGDNLIHLKYPEVDSGQLIERVTHYHPKYPRITIKQ